MITYCELIGGPRRRRISVSRAWRLLLLGLLLLPVNLWAGEATDAIPEGRRMIEAVEAVPEGRTIAVTGKVSVKGSVPHAYLCLTTDEGVDYRLVGPLQEQILKHYQQQRLRLEGEIQKAALGPGFPAELMVTDFQVVDDS